MGRKKGMQKGNTMNRKPEQDGSERHRLTLSAVRWNTPWDPLEGALPRREGGSRIPTLCRERRGGRQNKKGNCKDKPVIFVFAFLK